MSKLDKLWATILPRLAKDSNPDEVKEEVAKIVEDEDGEEKPKTANDNQTQAEKDNEAEAMRLKEREQREKEDREKDEKMAKDSRLAMDSLRNQMRGEFKALREAEHLCEPLIGRVACDSADEVYRMALKHKGVQNVDSLHSSALRPMVEMLQSNKMAQDSAPVINTDSRTRVSEFFKGE